MGEKTKIEWTDHTFNPWWGCTRVSPGCEHCYAETFAKRVGQKVWGVQAERRFFGDAHWAEPLKWERVAAKLGERRRVFCASMADVFEDRPDLVAQRARLHALVRETPHLDWLLLTKRPENADRLWSAANVDAFDGSESLGPTWTRNVWLGTTVEDQQRADERIPHLLRAPAAVRFLSCEPLLERIDLNRIDATKAGWRGVNGHDGTISAFAQWQHSPMRAKLQAGIDWVIVGGESGPGARPFDLGWARSVVSQCKAASVPVFFKQAGAVVVSSDVQDYVGRKSWMWHSGLKQRLAIRLNDRKGGDLAELPADLHVREFPHVV